MTHVVENNWEEGLHFEADGPGGSIALDADNAVGGQGKGLRPKPLMLTAMAGCTSMDVASLLKKMRAETEDFKVKVSGELTEEHPKYYHSVKIDYFFYGKEFKKDKIERAVKLSMERYCGVIDMFKKFAQVDKEIHYVEQ